MRMYGPRGERISAATWASIVESGEKFVARTDLPGGVWVSTVYLGLDHSFGSGPPLIFETMVFGSENMAGLDTLRYSTKEEAEAGHDRMVTKWTGWTPGDDEPLEEDDE